MWRDTYYMNDFSVGRIPFIINTWILTWMISLPCVSYYKVSGDLTAIIYSTSKSLKTLGLTSSHKYHQWVVEVFIWMFLVFGTLITPITWVIFPCMVYSIWFSPVWVASCFYILPLWIKYPPPPLTNTYKCSLWDPTMIRVVLETSKL